jgi:uncharacterized repeat protein (TIGR01451 family)
MRSAKLLTFSCLGFASTLLVPGVGSAQDLALRTQVDQHGDFVMFGNTLGWDCSVSTTNRILTGTIPNNGCNGTGNDSGIDIYWRSDEPGAGQAQASTSITMANARSTAMLVLPAGARVTYARLYWAAYLGATGTADRTVTIERPGSYKLDVNDTGVQSWTTAINTGSTDRWYQSTVDITDFVSTAGPGAFRVSGVSSVDNLSALNSEYSMAGWAVVVFYERAADPPRNLALFDGLARVNTTTQQNVTLSGFLVPQAGYKAKLGVLGYEGDSGTTTDELRFNNHLLSDALNPGSDFFNSSHSDLGVGVSNVGDLPRLSGTAGSMGGVDMDVVDITDYVQRGDTSASVNARTGTGGGSDRYVIGSFITSISTFKPDFTTSGKTVRDINGGAIRPNDILEYTVTATNTGNDTSTNTVMTDVLPAGVTYVQNSIKLLTPTALDISDTAGNDTGEYDAASRTVRVRLGTGANGTTGGTMAVGSTITLRFQVTLNGNASGTIVNQAVINAGGALGAPPDDFPTDGNGPEGGAPPTPVVVDECETDAQCTVAPKLHCDTALSPAKCVACLTSAQCTNPAIPDCNPTTQVCECAAGPGNCQDSDQDGMSDAQEGIVGTDPNDADSDDDGVPDGSEPAPSTDSDNDGLINALDPDSDNDGLFDGTELGFGCSGAGTNQGARRCIPDADSGATKTDPIAADTDGGGRRDGGEDTNLNGVLDANETNPTSGHGTDDTLADSDGDGLPDALELFLHSNPQDRDSDDDGVLDGDELNPSDDLDLDGLINLLDPDSDDDGLFDGTELGLGCANADTDASAGSCRADADAGQSRTSPLLWDTDHGNASDGSEDINLDGRVDTGETNPTATHASDDAPLLDSDGDGLSDVFEEALHSYPNDADSDDDGAKDGEEANPSADTDGDGIINVLDPDSDGDGLFDGMELGFPCTGARGTAANIPATCVADGDLGQTWTSPVSRDTDHGGVLDGAEDVNHNGLVDVGERDPNLYSDDLNCQSDADCDPSTTSGRVCNGSHVCVAGCRGSGGNSCPNGQTCSSTDSSIGTCSSVGGAGGAAGAAGAAGSSGDASGGQGQTATGGTGPASGGAESTGGSTAVALGGAGPASGGAESTGGNTSVASGGTLTTGGTTSSNNGDGGTPAAGSSSVIENGGSNGSGGTNASAGSVAVAGNPAIGGSLGVAGQQPSLGGGVSGGANNAGGALAAAGNVARAGASSSTTTTLVNAGGALTTSNVTSSAGVSAVVSGGSNADTTAVAAAGTATTSAATSGGVGSPNTGAIGGSENTEPSASGGAESVATGSSTRAWNEGDSLEGGGCDCATHNATGSSKLWLLMLTLGLIRRRRSGSKQAKSGT